MANSSTRTTKTDIVVPNNNSGNADVALNPSGTGIVDIQKDLRVRETVRFDMSNDAASGANATLTAPATKEIRLTNASLVSVDMIPAGSSGQEITLINATGVDLQINDNTGATAANRILTGTKGTIDLKDEASIGLVYDSTESRWMVVGGVGANASSSLNTIFQLTASEQISAWSTGDNATFLGGGTMAGTFVRNTSTPLNGTADYLYTQAASSLDDYAASPVQSVPVKFRGNIAYLSFNYKYNGGSSDILPIVYDVTNASIISNSTLYISNATNSAQTYVIAVAIPSTCTQVRFGFHVKTLDSGKVFQFDDVQLSSDYLSTIQMQVNSDWTAYTPVFTGFGTVSNVEFQYKRQGSDLLVRGKVTAGTRSGGELRISLPTGLTSASTSSIPTIQSSGVFFSSNTTAHGGAVLIEPSVTYLTQSDDNVFSGSSSPNALTKSTATSAQFSSGNQLTYQARVPIAGWVETSPVVIAANADYDWTAYTPTFTGFGTASGVTAYHKRQGSDLLLRVSWTAGSTTGVEARVSFPAGLVASSAMATIEACGHYTIDNTNNSDALSCEPGVGYFTFQQRNGATFNLVKLDGNIFSSTSKMSAYARIPIQGWTNSNINLVLGIPYIATIADEKTSGTSAGAFTAGAWQTRELNTLSDPQGVVSSLASNQFTLQAGTYFIEASASARLVDNHKIKLRNITDSSDAIIGTSERSASVDGTATSSQLQGQIVITSPKTFELQHRCETTGAFGIANAFGVAEVYATVKIQRVK